MTTRKTTRRGFLGIAASLAAGGVANAQHLVNPYIFGGAEAAAAFVPPLDRAPRVGDARFATNASTAKYPETWKYRAATWFAMTQQWRPGGLFRCIDRLSLSFNVTADDNEDWAGAGVDSGLYGVEALSATSDLHGPGIQNFNGTYATILWWGYIPSSSVGGAVTWLCHAGANAGSNTVIHARYDTSGDVRVHASLAAGGNSRAITTSAPLVAGGEFCIAASHNNADPVIVINGEVPPQTTDGGGDTDSNSCGFGGPPAGGGNRLVGTHAAMAVWYQPSSTALLRLITADPRRLIWRK